MGTMEASPPINIFWKSDTVVRSLRDLLPLTIRVFLIFRYTVFDPVIARLNGYSTHIPFQPHHCIASCFPSLPSFPLLKCSLAPLKRFVGAYPSVSLHPAFTH